MARWRITLWLADQPDIRLRIHRQYKCKLCAIMYVHKRAAEMAEVHHIGPLDIGWDLEMLKGVVDGWDIVYTSRMPRLSKVSRHACK